jgi:SPX domain protein involved in polyphosphate accumulation
MYLDDDERKYLNNFYFYYHLRRLEPKVLVVYDREPFQCKFGSNLRITIDKNLRSKIVNDYDMLFDEEGLVSSFRNEFILEIKFYQVLPEWIDKVIGRYDLTRIAVSKYTSSIDAQSRSLISLNKSNRNDFYNGTQ